MTDGVACIRTHLDHAGGHLMETISAIALSLALGAGAIIGKEVVSAVVKDAYASLKNLVKTRYPNVPLEIIDQGPNSKARRAVVEEELKAAGADRDEDLAKSAKALIDLIQNNEPAAISATGVDMKDVTAANIRLSNIIASGAGIVMKNVRTPGDIDIRDVRVGAPFFNNRDS